MIQVIGRYLKIPPSEKLIAYEDDNAVEVRVFELTNMTLADMFFKLDILKYNVAVPGVVEPTKTIEDDRILLAWTVESTEIDVVGPLEVQIRAFADETADTEKWHSGWGEFKVGKSILAEHPFPSVLPTEFGQMEQRVTVLAGEVSADAQAVAENTGTATTKAGEATSSASAAKTSEDNAKLSENAAKASETTATTKAEEAEQSATDALNNILNGVDTHNQNTSAHADIREDIREVEAIARGRATAYVFNTYADMTAWIAISANVESLVVGDNLYIRDTNVKDYWWDGTAAQELEAEAPDLTDYYTKVQVEAMMPILITRTAYDALVAAGTVEAGRTYDIIEG